MNDPLLLRRQVILVIDDDDATCEALASILGDEEYLVVTARTGAEGLEIMRTAPIDVAIVDLMMPEMDGWGFVAAVREDLALSGTPVLVMTAHGDRVLATAPVASGYFKKPIVLDRLLQVLHRTLTLRPPANDVATKRTSGTMPAVGSLRAPRVPQLASGDDEE
jgi:DNA-binding response OmpR family regulator